jgi:hypothetical protein
MKTTFSTLVCLAIVAALVRELPAGPNRAGARGYGKSAPVVIRPGRSRIYFGSPYVYPNGFHPGYYPPTIVISPYFQPDYRVPTVVVTSRYFCVLHNEGFVSRVGLLDHLAGTHKVPLDAAASFCPDGIAACIFPAY